MFEKSFSFFLCPFSHTNNISVFYFRPFSYFLSSSRGSDFAAVAMLNKVTLMASFHVLKRGAAKRGGQASTTSIVVHTVLQACAPTGHPAQD